MEPACAFELLSHFQECTWRLLWNYLLCVSRAQEVRLAAGNRRSVSKKVLGGLFWFGFPHFMPVVLWMSSSYLVVRQLNDDSSEYGQIQTKKSCLKTLCQSQLVQISKIIPPFISAKRVILYHLLSCFLPLGRQKLKENKWERKRSPNYLFRLSLFNEQISNII